MLSPVTERFIAALEPNNRDQSEGSLYHRTVNMTKGVLVVDGEKDAIPLVKACFEARFPVAVDVVRHDPNVPRIETATEEIVGANEILNFLKREH